MPLSEAQRRAKNKYDLKHYTTIAVKLPIPAADAFRAYCTDNAITPSAALRYAIQLYINKKLSLPDAAAIGDNDAIPGDNNREVGE